MLISTPIFYANGKPHIGHLYTAVLGDCISRHARLSSSNVVYMTGTDEHGQKVYKTSLEAGKTPFELVSENSESFRSSFDRLDIAYDDYIRTTEERHKKVVQKVWTRLRDENCITLGDHVGWYCQSEESFFPEKEIYHKDGTAFVKGIDREAVQVAVYIWEENYVFNLGKYLPQVKEWIETTSPIWPKAYENDVLVLLQDRQAEVTLSVSRLKKNLPWGIQVPDDENHTIYVWLDALSNYLTVAGYFEENDEFHNLWPPEIQIIGKDILKFHSIYWPAFLFALGLEPPKTLLVHGHWTKEGTKMSKTLGNFISSEDLLKHDKDHVRYFLLHDGTHNLSKDYDFSNEIFKNVCHNDLCNNIGNLFSRLSTPKVFPWKAGMYPQCDTNAEFYQDKGVQEVVKILNSLQLTVQTNHEKFQYAKTLDVLQDIGTLCNRIVTDKEPWVTVKNLRESHDPLLENNHFQLYHLLHESLRNIFIVLQAFTPSSASKALDQLLIPQSERNFSVLGFQQNISKISEQMNNSESKKLFESRKAKYQPFPKPQ